jgi:hypothetical protein
MKQPPPPIRQDPERLIQLRVELERMSALPEIHNYRFVKTLLEVSIDQEARIQRLEREIKTLSGQGQ